MGQQQLLLLVLSTVIVGLATVAGIEAFDAGQTQANQRALQQTAIEIASEAQAKLKKPSSLGGQDGYSSGSGLTIGELGYPTESASDLSTPDNAAGVYTTTNGECTMEASKVSPDGSETGVSSVTGDPVVSCASEDNHVVVGIDGGSPSDLNSKATTVVASSEPS